MRLEPSSPWHLDYATESCKLMRHFGEGENVVGFVLERFSPGESFSLWLNGEPLKFNRERSVSIRFGPNEAEQELPLYLAEAAGRPAIVIANVPSITPRSTPLPKKLNAKGWTVPIPPTHSIREEGVTQLVMEFGLANRTLILELGSMGKPFNALRACTTELIRDWGINPDAARKLARRPKPTSSPGNWITSRDYPSIRLILGERAIVNFRLMIDEKGEPTECRIQSALGHEDFKATVCAKIIKKAHFEPAMDSNGNPMSWYYQSSVRFHIPK